MNAEQWKRVKPLLEEVIDHDPAERGSYLDRVCDGDPELRREIESLLFSHEQAGTGFLKTPAVALHQSLPVRTRVGLRIGAYDILEELGHGGMGEVYGAARADGQFTKDVAVKLVRGGFDTAAVIERFRHERQILAGLEHPNIARLLDAGTTDDGIPYLVMELIHGDPIDDYCRSHLLGVASRLRLFLQVCAAVQYAHQRLIIHRDIKPGNILVTEEGVPKLLDFGIAKILDPAASPEGTVSPLTPQYASPEQIRGEPITTASDVYSLGVVLYQILTGRSPYSVKTNTPHELWRAITETQPQRPSAVAEKTEVPRKLDADLDNIVLKALRKEPEHRYGSVEQFAGDIRRNLEGLPVTATKGSWKYRAGKFARRHKSGVAAAALVVLAVTLGLVATIREARVAAVNERRAERRFNDVRDLAGSLMFEIHDSIASLPGATPARKLIVQRSLVYLDSLSREAGGDVSLQRELANAYMKLGQVQGTATGSNLGDGKGALESFRKALSIRRGISESASKGVEDRIAVAEAERLIGLVLWMDLDSSTQALENVRNAVALAEHVNREFPDSALAAIELADDYRQLADILEGDGIRAGTGDIAGAIQLQRKELEIRKRLANLAPSDAMRQQRLGGAYFRVADDLVKEGRREEALQYYEQARNLFTPLAQDKNNTFFRGSLAVCYSAMGDLFLMNGKPLDALAAYQQDQRLIEPLAKADPTDIHVQLKLTGATASVGYALTHAGRSAEGKKLLSRALTLVTSLPGAEHDSQIRGYRGFITVWEGQESQKAGDVRAALRDYHEALEIYSGLARADSQDIEDRVSLSEVHGHLGSAYLQGGDTAEATDEYRQAYALANSLLSSRTDNMEILYAVADATAGLGKSSAALAQKTDDINERYRHWIDANDWYQKSIASWKRIPNPSHIAPNIFEVVDAEQVSYEAKIVKDRSEAVRRAVFSPQLRSPHLSNYK